MSLRFAERLRARRQELGLTQAEVAKRADEMQQSDLADIESGKRPSLNLDTMTRLAEAVSSTVDELLGLCSRQ